VSGKFAVVWPSRPKLDGKRAFRGKPQLSHRDQDILKAVEQQGLRVCHEVGETVFRCGGDKLPRQAVLRLFQLEYLVPGDGGSFGDDPQLYLVNITR